MARSGGLPSPSGARVAGYRRAVRGPRLAAPSTNSVAGSGLVFADARRSTTSRACRTSPAGRRLIGRRGLVSGRARRSATPGRRTARTLAYLVAGEGPIHIVYQFDCSFGDVDAALVMPHDRWAQWLRALASLGRRYLYSTSAAPVCPTASAGSLHPRSGWTTSGRSWTRPVRSARCSMAFSKGRATLGPLRRHLPGADVRSLVGVFDPWHALERLPTIRGGRDPDDAATEHRRSNSSRGATEANGDCVLSTSRQSEGQRVP